jgi:maltose alpha-D-glucosyltransferase/alpha-amylase
LLTLPGVPFIYYGDEIGMRFLDVPTKEGGYTRTGSRTPMQWDGSENKGFSTAAQDKLYLPVDSSADAPTVEDQEKDVDSLLNTVRRLVEFKAGSSDFDADGDFAVLHAGDDEPFVYRRGCHICLVNPSSRSLKVSDGFLEDKEAVFTIGSCTRDGCSVTIEAGSFAVFF